MKAWEEETPEVGSDEYREMIRDQTIMAQEERFQSEEEKDD